MAGDYVELEDLAMAGAKISRCLEEIINTTKSDDALTMIIQIQEISRRQALPAMREVQKRRADAAKLVQGLE